MDKRTEVMVLDDEPIVVERLKEFLEAKGMSVETFTESEKAVVRIREKRFDVVITDWKMRGPTGMDVLLAIKEHCPSTQVIMITAYFDHERLLEAEVGGAFEFVGKPFQLASIHKLVTKAAKRAQKQHPRSPVETTASPEPSEP